MANNPLQSTPPLSMNDIIIEKEFTSGTTKNLAQLVTENDGQTPHIVLNTLNPAPLISRIQEVPRSLLAWLGYDHSLTGSGTDGTEIITGTTGMMHQLTKTGQADDYPNLTYFTNLKRSYVESIIKAKNNSTVFIETPSDTASVFINTYSSPATSPYDELYTFFYVALGRAYAKIPLSSITDYDINKAEIRFTVSGFGSMPEFRLMLVYYSNTTICTGYWSSSENTNIISDVVMVTGNGTITFTLNSLGVELLKQQAQGSDKYFRVGVLLFDKDYLEEPALGSNLISGTDSDMSGSNNWNPVGYTSLEVDYDDGVGFSSLRIRKTDPTVSWFGTELDSSNIEILDTGSSDYSFSTETANTYSIAFRYRWVNEPQTISLGQKAHLELNGNHVRCGIAEYGMYGSYFNGYSSSWEKACTSEKIDSIISSGLIFYPEDLASYADRTTELLIAEVELYKHFFLASLGCTLAPSTEFLKTYNKTTSVPTLTTTTVYSINTTTAYSGGNISNDGGDSVLSRGVCWNTAGTPTIANSKTTDGSGVGSFASYITSLSPGTTYFVRAYATNGVGTGYGNQESFSTLEDVPVLTTDTVTAGTNGTTATSGGNITAANGAIIARGVCWNQTGSPTTLDDKTSDGTGSGSFTSNISGLAYGESYYVRAYASNSTYTGYGDQKTVTMWNYATFTDGVFDVKSATMFQVKNIDITATGDGSSTVDKLGLVAKIGSVPTISNYDYEYHVTEQTVANGYVLTLSGMASGYTYQYRVYVQNNVGYKYGAVSEVTLGAIPTLSTVSVSNIDNDSADSGGTGISDNGPSISTKGCVCKAGSVPTILSYDVKTNDGSGTASFSSSLTGLVASTTYYVRAYATNILGTGYGGRETFATLGSTPSLTTDAVTRTSSSTADSGGNVTSVGGSSVTAWGVCWNTTGSPTTSSSKDNYTGTQASPFSFDADLNTLVNGTIYYARAYATNSHGTSYGNEIVYSHIDNASVTTDTPVWVNGSIADCGGNITYDGGQFPLTEHGIVWGSSINPTTGSYLGKVSISGGTEGVFDADMTSLTINATYYVRAYVINDAGTSYGNEIQYVHVDSS